MTCTNPLIHPDYGMIPCGKCIACRIFITREWSIRLIHEYYFHQKSIFLTLSYSDKNLPEDLSVSKREAILYIKRLRKSVEPEHIRYYISGEYGDQTNRPHYHAIIFGIGLEDHKLYKSKTQGGWLSAGPAYEAWKKGWVYGGTVTDDSCMYVARYLQKKLYGDLAKQDPRQQPFSLKSNGIGRPWMEKHAEEIKHYLKITHRGIEHSIPKYYVKKLGISQLLQMQADYSKQLKSSHYDSKYQNTERWIAEKNHRIQQAKNLESKQLNIPRGNL